MTPQERRQSIVGRIEAGGWSISKVIRESDYTGIQAYIEGNSATDENIYKVEQALTRLEKGKDK